jgi:6-pyruvoyltetrahydropterin/6-carboxytetrahydropterin synthase
VAGVADADSSMIVNITDLDRILKEEVDRPLDHHNLNLEIPEFQARVPTAENLARWIWERVETRIEKERWPCRLAALKLTVTPTFSVELVSEEEKIS